MTILISISINNHTSRQNFLWWCYLCVWISSFINFRFLEIFASIIPHMMSFPSESCSQHQVNPCTGRCSASQSLPVWIYTAVSFGWDSRASGNTTPPDLMVFFLVSEVSGFKGQHECNTKFNPSELWGLSSIWYQIWCISQMGSECLLLQSHMATAAGSNVTHMRPHTHTHTHFVLSLFFLSLRKTIHLYFHKGESFL